MTINLNTGHLLADGTGTRTATSICLALSQRRVSGVLLLCTFVLWAALSITLYMQLLYYNRVPGAWSFPAKSWPATTKLMPELNGFTLVVFIHPRCPCSMATLSELAKLRTRCRAMKCFVVFFQPEMSAKDWLKTPSLYRAMAIPGTTLIEDAGGLEAARFGTTTSGETLLFDRNRRLVFKGGITASRGHEGDNLGLSVVETLVRDQAPTPLRSTPVFGCSLLNP
jgi:hypothetical protein